MEQEHIHKDKEMKCERKKKKTKKHEICPTLRPPLVDGLCLSAGGSGGVVSDRSLSPHDEPPATERAGDSEAIDFDS